MKKFCLTAGFGHIGSKNSPTQDLRIIEFKREK